MAQFNEIAEGDVLQCYESWQSPTVIISDGAYGLGMFPGEPKNIEGLLDWYRPHIEEWSKKALPSTTLWFWNTEVISSIWKHLY